MKPLISIIMPAYNAERYIKQAIGSVLDQSYPNWELLIVNDGSTDETSQIISCFKDPRIKYFEQPNKGVSAARNLALNHALGEFLCFLDSDDIFPAHSLESRLTLFHQYPELSFADGMVELYDENISRLLSRKYHTYKGVVFDRLIALDNSCYLGLTWMVRSSAVKDLRFQEGMTHGEDLLYFIIAARQKGLYMATADCILLYRRGRSSAMSNLAGLSMGYRKLFEEIAKMPEVSFHQLWLLRLKIKKIMVLSFLAAKQYKDAFNALISVP